VEEAFGPEPREQVRILTAVSVAALLRFGLIEVGLPAEGFRDFAPDSSPPEVIEERIYDEWDGRPSPSQVAIWMNATRLGRAVHEGTVSDEPLNQAVIWAREAAARRGLSVPTEPTPAEGPEPPELRNVRDLPDGPEHARAYHERLRGGGVDVTPAGFDPEGAITRLQDASFIIWRPRSADGTPALDLDIPTRGKLKLRFRG
jgi:hypothetical protein